MTVSSKRWTDRRFHVGFAIGVERLAILLRAKEGSKPAGPALYVAWIGAQARDWAFPAVHRLRRRGLSVELEAEARSLKSQMRRADKLKADSVLIVGDDELQKRRALLRRMATKEQEEVDFEKIETVLMARKAN
jgi:histidyl-tRNA synthetase